jgi:AraC-like DNA-binding protein
MIWKTEEVKEKQFPFGYALDVETERKLIAAIKRGAVGETRDALCMLSFPPVPDELSEKDLQDMQNAILGFISLLYYVSVQAGFERSAAASLTERYMEKAKWVQTFEEMKMLINTAALHFAKKVGDSIPGRCGSGSTEQIIAFIDNHICENIKTNDIAEHIGKSVPNTCRMFKEQMGITITTYIQKRKIDYAAFLLAGTDKQINEVSDTAGFSNQQHFEKVFKRVMGVTPRNFRKNHTEHPMNEKQSETSMLQKFRIPTRREYAMGSLMRGAQ